NPRSGPCSPRDRGVRFPTDRPGGPVPRRRGHDVGDSGMRVTLWGTRGSLASPGPDTARYGGNTSCVEVEGADGTVLVLDAGTGIRRLGGTLPKSLSRVDLLLTHLHMDHVQGLGFFAPLYNPAVAVHIWGPASTTLSLRKRLT